MNPRCLVLVLLASLGLATVAAAQPFGAWLVFSSATGGRVTIPHAAALNPTSGFTLEAWVDITLPSEGESCKSIAGKGYLQAWWIGVCNLDGQPTLRSFLKGGSSSRTAGMVPAGVWTHVAVTFDGARRRHYINGELVLDVAESGPLTTGTSELRIGSDVSWPYTPNGSLDEVRLWSVARTQAELRGAINRQITMAQPGLVAVWPLDANGDDVIGSHDGVVSNAFGWTFPVTLDCGAGSSTFACLNDHFGVTVRWRTSPAGHPTNGSGRVVLASADSALFWFFAPSNWELMVKVLDGCGLNDRFWVFSAATTNVFYRIEVIDVRAGVQKIYFNYPGPPAPAVTDIGAFASCP